MSIFIKYKKRENIKDVCCVPLFRDLHFLYPVLKVRKDECGSVVFTRFKRFIRLCVSVGPRMLYFTINNLANLNFILATKVNRG